jgi:hypothetical protein
MLLLRLQSLRASLLLCVTRRRFVEILPSKGAVQRMCADFKVPMLPSIPMDPALVQACEQGRHLCVAAGVAATGAALALQQLTTTVMLEPLTLFPSECSA